MIRSDVFREFRIINDDVPSELSEIAQRNSCGILFQETLRMVGHERTCAGLFSQKIQAI